MILMRRGRLMVGGSFRSVPSELCTCSLMLSILQTRLPGGVIAPIILASDKTQLSTFGGDKEDPW